MSGDWTGQRLELEVDAVAHGGHCVGRFEGRVVFVRHALPGELVIAEVTEDRGGSFCRAEAVEVVRAAQGRVQPPCPLAVPAGCGGCDWQHADAPTQRRLKADVVREQLGRLAGIDRDVEVEALPGGTLGWRSRLRLVAGSDGRLGFRAHRSHRVVPVEEHGCRIAVPGSVDEVLGQRWRPGTEVAVTRDSTGETHISAYEGAGERARARQVRGGTAHERAAGREWRVDAHGFWQVHPHAAEALATVVGEWAGAPAGAHTWDLYAGVGLFAAVLAEQVGPSGSVLAVESARGAVEAGRRNLADLPQVRWRRGAVHRVIAAHPARAPEVVVLDPPRKGAGSRVVRSIACAGARRVVYVSCDPAALARDLATFADAGYHLCELRAFDAFPMTHHVECVALLTTR
ncbi:23S rRNA m(5)U-1939 methyltransferase [Haloechinothrix alba]|uniref:23S rRNA m(5)U-1939 methyltransferase n=1 Tax=Haloechinothrix alba TaxID=664784 RepID=A0A238X5S6_9PSEU|nr:TRAM domain-containing protein [Haloechinothrix alba]SNR54415.1 23S rRNA m(5)U-1939 methyltransferase [Haloechinothrix alba]